MDQSFPPRPALFLRLMLILKPSRFRQPFSKLRVTHPIYYNPLAIIHGGFDHVRVAIESAGPKCGSIRSTLASIGPISECARV
jgi:hypothetical protein